MSWMQNRGLNRKRRLEAREMLGLPNYVTYGRIIIIPVIAVLLLPINDWDARFVRWDQFASLIGSILFTIAGISDGVDGYLARRYKFNSTFGKFIDPLADKLLSFTALIILLSLQRVPAWVVVLLIARDTTITSLRAVAADDGVIISASQWGKYKTFMSNFSLAFLIAHYSFLGLHCHAIGMVLLAFYFIISMGSGIHYVHGFFSEIIEKKTHEET